MHALPLRLYNNDALPDWSTYRNSLFRRLADMSSLFQPRRALSLTAHTEDWEKIAANRSAPIPVRLRASLFLRYSAATSARESDNFLRDAKTWATFEHAVMPELENFNFFDPDRQTFIVPSAVLADAMFHLWTATDLGLDTHGRPTTIAIISELARYLCSIYQTTPIDQHASKKNWLGI